MRRLRLAIYIIGASMATGFAAAAAVQQEYFAATLFAASSSLYLFLLKGEL